jgi:hypothetical protein
MITLGRYMPVSVSVDRLAAPEHRFGNLSVEPQALSIAVGRAGGGWGRQGGGDGGVMFTRTWPSVVLVNDNGTTRRIPVIDLTRWAQFAVVLAGILALYGMWTKTKTRKER